MTVRSNCQLNGITYAAIVVTMTLMGRTAEAVQVPFQVFSGAGTVDFIPLVEGQTANHDIAAGFATLLGNYTGQGVVRLDMFTSATTAEFSSAQPFVFTGQNGDELGFNYTGVVALADAGGGLFTSTWSGEFNPAPGTGTGEFADVEGGSFIMTALTEAFEPGVSTDVAYTWSSDEGYLLFVPEPSSLALLVPAALVYFSRRLRANRHI